MSAKYWTENGYELSGSLVATARSSRWSRIPKGMVMGKDGKYRMVTKGDIKYGTVKSSSTIKPVSAIVRLPVSVTAKQSAIAARNYSAIAARAATDKAVSDKIKAYDPRKFGYQGPINFRNIKMPYPSAASLPVPSAASLPVPSAASLPVPSAAVSYSSESPVAVSVPQEKSLPSEKKDANSIIPIGLGISLLALLLK